MNKLLAFSKRVLALSIGLLIFFACHITSTQETEETFTFPTLKDKIAGADHVNITLKDTAGNVIDVLFNGPVDSSTSFKNLAAKNYPGGKVVIDIEAKQGTVVIYSVERTYDASKGGNQGQIVLIAPNMGVDFKLPSLRLREGEVVALPEVVILPSDLGNKGLRWISRSPQILEVAGQTLKALIPGKATLVVALQADSSKKDSLDVEVFSKTDPIKPIDTLLLSPDTLRLALKGPEGRFTVRTAPTTASPAAAWTSLNPLLFSIDSTGLLKPLAEGLGRAVAVSKLDATVSDTAFVLVLPPQKVDSVRFQKATTDLFVGGAAESLTVAVHPPLANPAITLTAEDTSLVSVSGLTLRGLKEGETRVFARSIEDPSRADTLTVVLFPAERVDSVRLKQDSVKLYVRGESQTLTATLHPTTLQPRFLWRSADGKVVTVDATGKVSPVSAGKAFVSVTARADAGKRDSALVIVKLDMPRLQVGQDTIISAGITLTHRPVVTQEYGLVVMFKWDLHGDGTFEDSSSTVPATLASQYGEVKDYKAAFYIRDTEGNDTVYHRQIKTVTGRVVQITAPKDGSFTNQSPIPVNWTVDGQPLSNTQALNPGANTVTREARDSAGKVFSHTITVHLDQTPPNRPTVKASSLPVNTLTPGWTWVSGGGGGNATYRYRLDNPDMSAATVTTDTFFTAPTNLSEAVHTLYVQERDEAGNWSASGSAPVRIDTTAPKPPQLDSTPYSPLNDLRPRWTWKSGGGGKKVFRVWLNNSTPDKAVEIADSSFRPSESLKEGDNTLFVQECDSAGNWSPASNRKLFLISNGVIPGKSFPAGEVTHNSLAITNNDEVVIAYTGDFSEVKISKFSDHLWYDLPPSGLSYDGAPSLLVTSNNTPFIYFSNGTGDSLIRVFSFQNGGWASLSSNLPPGGYSDVSLGIDGQDSIFMAYNDFGPDSSVVRKFRNNEWVKLGTGHPNLKGYPYYALFLDVTRNGTPYLLSLSNGNAIARRLNNNIWAAMGFDGFAGGDTRYLGFSVDDIGNAIVSYPDHQHDNRISVKYFNGSDWYYLGQPALSTGSSQHLITHDQSGNPYLAITEISGSTKSLRLLRFQDSRWNLMCKTDHHISSTFHSLRVDSKGIAYVALKDGSKGGSIAILRIANDP